MKTVVGVRFKKTNKMYYFAPGNLDVQKDDGVIVETARGVEFGEVVMGQTEVPEDKVVSPLKNVVRIATEADRKKLVRNAEEEQRTLKVFEQKILDHKLDMKAVDVEYAFDGGKITFFFTADGRVDFRELVKDLAHHFKARIELRQIGVRDEAKMLGGVGRCGVPICCKQFLTDFSPVSIKMAKEQNISLNPTKISGLCGRLMCCLGYEQKLYEEVGRRMPRNNAVVQTPDGRGTVAELFMLTEKVKVRVEKEDGSYEFKTFPLEELQFEARSDKKAPPHKPKKDSKRNRTKNHGKKKDKPAAPAATAAEKTQ